MGELPVPLNWKPLRSVVTHSKQRRLFAVAVSFWTGVTLPLAYPVLFIAGIESAMDIALFAGVVWLHAVSLFGGHQYDRDRRQTETTACES
jgi:hypothetical protein